MFNSFAYAKSSSSSSASANNHNEVNINDYKPIVRSNEESYFKKLKINSVDFDLMLGTTPCIFKDYTKEEDHDRYNDYIIYYTTIQVISFNQISSDTMLVEYRIIGSTTETIKASIFKKWTSGGFYYEIPDNELKNELKLRLKKYTE
jgi:hypothetical protein